MAPKSKGTLKNTPANRPEIVSLIENKLGPVGPGHHNSHRSAHLMEWLRSKGTK